MTKEISLKTDNGYTKFLDLVKDRLIITQFKLAQSINKEVVNFYWRLGTDIVEAQESNDLTNISMHN